MHARVVPVQRCPNRGVPLNNPHKMYVLCEYAYWNELMSLDPLSGDL